MEGGGGGGGREQEKEQERNSPLQEEMQGAFLITL